MKNHTRLGKWELCSWEEITDWCARYGVTLTALASYLSTSCNVLQNWKRGTHYPSLENQTRLRILLDTQLSADPAKKAQQLGDLWRRLNPNNAATQSQSKQIPQIPQDEMRIKLTMPWEENARNTF